jgi:hypothetical protein
MVSASLVHGDLRSIHGSSDDAVVDGVIQEIDIPTGLVVFEWHSLDHVSYGSSQMAAPKRSGKLYDYFHINSVGLAPDGSLIVSARNTSAIYDLDRQTGAVNWTLGGRASSFKMGPATGFAFQHDARIAPDGTITLFDDGAAPPVHKQSRALRLRLNLAARTVTWAGEDVHSPPLLAGFEGNAQQLRNGGLFVGWGQQPYFTEYDASGHVLFDGRFVAPTPNYRAYRLPWSGQPQTRPALAVARPGHGLTTIYASWNGATAVAAWQVLAGAGASTLAPHGRPVPRRGFETTIVVHSGGPYFAVQALTASGKLLGQSVALRGG